ncbi:MAG: alpha/beta fold hydrolase [Candidatus Sulfotelmatobacter sp.]
MSPRNRAAFLGVFLAAALAATNLGCGGASAAPPPPPVISVSLDTTSSTLLESSTEPFTATLLNDVNNKGVMWTVSCAAASCGSVSPGSTGNGASTTFTAPGPPASDLTVTLKASAAADPTKSATATITIPALSVSVAPSSATVQVATSLDVNGAVSNDAGTGNLNWTLTENGSTCSPGCGTISGASGPVVTYTAPATPPTSNTTVMVTASSATDSSKSASASLLIPSIGITVAPAAATVVGTKSVALTATLVNDKTNQGVNWAVSCPTAPCGSVSALSSLTGVPVTYTAPVPPASDLQVTITASAVANSNAAASALLTVPAIVVDVEPQSPDPVLATKTIQFTVTVTNDPNDAGVTWTVSCSATACGNVSPASTLSGGSVTYTAPALPSSDLSVAVIATSVTNPANSSQATVTVPAIAVSAVSPPSGIVPITGVPQFTATVNYDPTGQGLNWTLTQNGSDCTPGCGMMNPLSTGSPGTSAFNGPATLPANTSVELNAVSITDATKFSTSTLTLTNGTVQLLPASLTTFSCKLTPSIFAAKCPPPPQDVVLTNTGATALAITSISTTGAFSQTNTCGSSVAAGASCTISVTFTGMRVATFSGTLNLNDNSADSPQQVALQGTVRPSRLGNASGAQTNLAFTNSAAVPAPTGESVVGTRVLELVDSSRKDPYDATRNSRELAVRLWYPVSAHSNEPCKAADYASPKVWEYFGQLLKVSMFPVTTNSCQDAAVAEGVHPVVVFTPGLTATFTDYTFLMEDLASRGYIVVAVNHTYEATAVEFSDGRLVRSVVGSHLGGTLPRSPREARFAVDARLKDLKFVLRQLARLNAVRQGPFAGRLDLSRIVVAGHSLGGLTALLVNQSDPRVKGAILLDPVLPEVLPGPTNKPILLLGADRKEWTASECSLWRNLQGPRLAVSLQGTEHVALSDWIWLAKDAVKTGPMGPQKTMSAVRDYIGAFLDANLRGEQADPLLAGASLNYPDAGVTVQGQSLCGKPVESATVPVHPQR